MTSTGPTPGTGPTPDPAQAPGAGQTPDPRGRRPRRAPGRTIILGAFGLLDGLLLWPWALLGLLLAGLAVYEGWRQRHSAAGRVALGVALAGVVVAGLGTVIGFLIRDELDRYGQCQAGANTTEAQQVCQRQLDRDLQQRFGLVIPSV
ncbi:MAG: hypothetical protein ACTHMZ_15550 [Actinomycetes bacterium]